MGNTTSFWSGSSRSSFSRRSSSRRESRKESNAEPAGNSPSSIPEISVTEASPLPPQGAVFALPGPAQTCRTSQADSAVDGLRVQTEPRRDAEQNPEVIISYCADDDGHFDSLSLSGSDDLGTPTASRTHFIQVMMDSSPQVRRSMVQRRSVHLSNKSDGDSVSLGSSNPDEDRTLVTLDPLEHEWMMCASDGEWASLHHLLAKEPGFLLRKDFVTGFTCLHWAAKHGKPELVARIINFAKQHDVPISVDVRSNIGYTPLHIATMHNHMEVVKVLVGAYNADVEVRDYSGRKACQYLAADASADIQDIIGAYEQRNLEHKDSRDGGGGRRRFSKVLQANLKPLRLLSPSHCDSVDGDREKPVRRKSSLSRMKPNLQKLRHRASTIVHSTTFRDEDEPERSVERSRAKSHFFE